MGRWHIVTGPFASNAPHNDMKISWLPTIAAAAVIGTVIRVAMFTPLEARQGAAQKIFYIHVPAAWVAFLAFALVAIASGVFLWLRDQRLDRFA
jgi:heme exporter protein C